MADNYKSVIRCIEYYGPVEWLEATLANSRMPIQGTFKPSPDKEIYIKSGIIVWQPDSVTEKQVEHSENESDDVNGSDSNKGIRAEAIEDNSSKRSTVVFKRPGE